MNEKIVIVDDKEPIRTLPRCTLAGATSVFGLGEIKAAFARHGISASFADAPFMKDFAAAAETEPIIFAAQLPPEATVIPLSEFWISYCIKTGACRISRNALAASRSKLRLYELLGGAGFDVPVIYREKAQALSAVGRGGKVVVKPVGLHSGYGIEVLGAHNIEKLDEYMSQAASIKNRAVRIMEIQNEGCILTEFLQGTEYSADCFCFEGRVAIVRVCKKAVVLVRDKPCTAACQLVEPSEAQKKVLAAWTGALFESQDVSFAQFDFVQTEGGRTVPIDFACRVGGGMKELLACTAQNPYALAVAGKPLDLRGKTLTQLNYLPTKKGRIKNDGYELEEGFRAVYKRAGDYVTDNPSSVKSRIASVVSQSWTAENAPLHKLLLGEPWIGE